jgi:hypothetical protein
VVGGVTSVTGAGIGGLLLMLLPVLQSSFPAFAGAAFAGVGLVAAGLGRDPNGLASWLFRAGRVVGGRAAPARAVERSAEPAAVRGG